MSQLIPPHGGKGLINRMLSGQELEEEKKRAESLPKIKMTSREVGDFIMIATGGFSPLEGFMGKADWKGCCDEFKMADGTFWPIPITLSISKEEKDNFKEGQDAALVAEETGELMGIISITEIYDYDKELECKSVFRTTDTEHPGVAMVMQQGEYNVAGPIKAFSEGGFPEQFPGVYARPEETRKLFEEMGWKTVAALQLRNPMHRSHEYLAKIALEILDGVLIHQLIGKLKPGDIPADVRVKCIDVLIKHYFPENKAISKGYPLDMRYAGPREALLHAVFRQNYGCTHLLVGRDHAGVGDYYGPFDAHKIFDEIPKDSLLLQPLKIDWTFYCYKCDGMASMKTCPHSKEDRVILSGTMLRKLLSEGKEIPDHFGRPEVLEILREYYMSLTEKVEIKLHGHATGEAESKIER